jgi:hypothetical protein
VADGFAGQGQFSGGWGSRHREATRDIRVPSEVALSVSRLLEQGAVLGLDAFWQQVDRQTVRDRDFRSNRSSLGASVPDYPQIVAALETPAAQVKFSVAFYAPNAEQWAVEVTDIATKGREQLIMDNDHPTRAFGILEPHLHQREMLVAVGADLGNRQRVPDFCDPPLPPPPQPSPRPVPDSPRGPGTVPATRPPT